MRHGGVDWNWGSIDVMKVRTRASNLWNAGSPRFKSSSSPRVSWLLWEPIWICSMLPYPVNLIATSAPIGSARSWFCYLQSSVVHFNLLLHLIVYRHCMVFLQNLMGKCYLYDPWISQSSPLYPQLCSSCLLCHICPVIQRASARQVQCWSLMILPYFECCQINAPKVAFWEIKGFAVFGRAFLSQAVSLVFVTKYSQTHKASTVEFLD